MENNIINLSSIGFDNYYLTESGRLYKAAPTEKEIKADKLNRFYLIDNCGNEKRITKRKLYNQVFNKQLCIDEIETLQGEEWKEIENTQGKYFVSNLGRVKSYCGNKAIILKPYKKYNGYVEVKINNKNVMVHKLVAFAFCENRYKNTDIKAETHHKNKNRADNRAENLVILSIAEHHKEHNKKEVIDNE